MEHTERLMTPGHLYKLRRGDGTFLDEQIVNGRLVASSGGANVSASSFVLIGLDAESAERANGMGFIDGMRLTLHTDGSQLELVDCGLAEH